MNREKKITIRKSQPFVWLVFILAILIIGFAFTILMRPMGDVYNQYYNDTDVNETVYQDFYTRSKTIWDWTPLVIVIAMILWAIINIQVRNQYPS